MKKLVVLTPQNIKYVSALAKEMKHPKSKNGDFSKALRKIIEDHKK